MKHLIIIAALALTATSALATVCQERPTPTTHAKNAKLEQPHRPAARPQHRTGTAIPATRWTPSVWVGSDWQAGACPPRA